MTDRNMPGTSDRDHQAGAKTKTTEKPKGNPAARRWVQIIGAVLLLSAAFAICGASMVYGMGIMERHTKTARMMNEAISAAIVGPAFAAPWFAFGIMLLTRSLCTKGSVGAPEEKKIRRDLRMCIWAKTPIFTLMAASYTVFYVRYASQLAWWILGVTIVTDGIFLWMLCIALRRIYRVYRQKWELCPTYVIEKTVSINTNVDSDLPRRHCVLMLETKGYVWRKNVNDREYSRTHYDSALWAVCMEGKERPMILYNVNGDATW